jgi:hypothetical protein
MCTTRQFVAKLARNKRSFPFRCLVQSICDTPERQQRNVKNLNESGRLVLDWSEIEVHPIQNACERERALIGSYGRGAVFTHVEGVFK